MKLSDFAKNLKKFFSIGNIKDVASKALYKYDAQIVSDLQAFSPRDTGKFASNWKAKRLRFGSDKSLAGLKITNNTPGYAIYMEEGADPGQAPWYFPGAKKPTGKLMEHSGKIWAGGKNPGHHLTVGGPLKNVLREYGGILDKITLEITQGTIKGFK